VTQVSLKLRRPRDELRNHPGNPDDFDVVDGGGKIIGRVMKPGGGADHWFWRWNATGARCLLSRHSRAGART